MEITLSVPVLIIRGIGNLTYPEVLKREPLQTLIGCESLYFSKNDNAGNEPCLLTCSGSTYFGSNREVKSNMLGMVIKKKVANLITFSQKVPINRPQEVLEIEIVDYHGNRQEDVSCFALMNIQGKVANKLLAI